MSYVSKQINMEYTILNNGVRMPMLGFGVYQIENIDECRRCLSAALESGYRLIDTAAVYLNEEAVGKAVINSGIDRRELFITSKVWIQDMGYDSALSAFDRTLRRLSTDYLDLYFCICLLAMCSAHGALWRSYIARGVSVPLAFAISVKPAWLTL